MNLKMYVINEGDLTTDWVVAESEEQAVEIYDELSGINLYEEYKDNETNDIEDYIREMSMNEMMTYYPDGKNPDKDTIENIIKKYCTKPDFFATSEF